MIKLNLESLKKGLPTLSGAVGSYYSEAGIYCLDSQGHSNNVKLFTNLENNFSLNWNTQ